jgi:MFS family permease
MGGWRWTFFINVPVCVLVFILGLRMLPVPPKPRAQRFDSMGAALLLLAMPALLLGLSEGPSWGWQDPWVIAFLLTGLVGMALFLRSQHRKSSPLLQLELFTSRIFCGAAISAVANYIALFSVIILMPFVLEEGMRCSPLCTGMLLAAQPAIMAIVASPAGWLSDRIGSRLLATVGMSVLTGGLLLLATLGQDSSLWMYAGSLAVVGLGTGIFISPNSSALMGAAPRHLQGTASSILGEARTLGMLLGVTLGSGVYALWGGQTGTSWQAGDFGAMRAVMFAAAAVAATGALAAALRGKRTSSSVTQANT